MEALQVLRALHLDDYGWGNHPAVGMWRGHTRALVAYGLAVVEQWLRRGRADTTAEMIAEFAFPHAPAGQGGLPADDLPPWLGWAPLHRSHRSALLRKDPDIYGKLFDDEPDVLGYVWPSAQENIEPPRAFTAWVVRAADGMGSAELVRARSLVAVDTGLAGAASTPKQRRQVALLGSMRALQAVAVPTADGGLLVGRLASEPAPASASPTLAVRWGGRMARDELRRPYQLQDPRTVFALRDEPEVERVANAV